LQCVAVCCSVLQCVAVRCSALQRVAVCRIPLPDTTRAICTAQYTGQYAYAHSDEWWPSDDRVITEWWPSDDKSDDKRDAARVDQGRARRGRGERAGGWGVEAMRTVDGEGVSALAVDCRERVWCDERVADEHFFGAPFDAARLRYVCLLDLGTFRHACAVHFLERGILEGDIPQLARRGARVQLTLKIKGVPCRVVALCARDARIWLPSHLYGILSPRPYGFVHRHICMFVCACACACLCVGIFVYLQTCLCKKHFFFVKAGLYPNCGGEAHCAEAAARHRWRSRPVCTFNWALI